MKPILRPILNEPVNDAYYQLRKLYTIGTLQEVDTAVMFKQVVNESFYVIDAAFYEEINHENDWTREFE